MLQGPIRGEAELFTRPFRGGYFYGNGRRNRWTNALLRSSKWTRNLRDSIYVFFLPSLVFDQTIDAIFQLYSTRSMEKSSPDPRRASS
ncbi:hypothetical protein GWI33_010418 [Rhynchophorus ferrugineus]|uniref:Uncharacterized protein n=1 Tax=Rhynchophorus ferrugineus TaxID=354439 RepID=A0A834MJ06_RHYFE|nr:hypothetical protein GWI33_010418 [Rhynchophorus ferrugineus]